MTTPVASATLLNQMYSSLSTTPSQNLSVSKTVENSINAFLNVVDASNYLVMATDLSNWLANSSYSTAVGGYTNIPGARIQIIGSSGVTYYDSSSGTSNTYANIGIPRTTWLATGKYLINENQGLRSYNMGAFLSSSGVFVQTNYSNSVNINQMYLAVRQGNSPQQTLGNVVITVNSS
jgi:hypothetical protein